MIADRAWVERNLGFDPVATPAPPETYSFRRAPRTKAREDFAREIIDFDSAAPEGLQFLAFSKATGAFALRRHSLAGGTCAHDRRTRWRAGKRAAAQGGRASRHLDRR